MRILRLALLLVLITSAHATKAQLALHALYTPMQLQADTTVLFLRDYLGDETSLTLKAPLGLEVISIGKDTLLLKGKMAQKLGVLEIQTANGIRDLLLINSSSVKGEIKIKADQIQGKSVRIIGSFNNWNRGSKELVSENGYYRLPYRLEPGRYAYKLYVDGEEMLDPQNAQKEPNGLGGFNNLLVVPAPQGPSAEMYQLRLDKATVAKPDANGKQKVAWADKVILEGPQENAYIAFWENREIAIQESNGQRFVLIPQEATRLQRSHLRIYAYAGNDMGVDALLPLAYGKVMQSASELNRSDWHSARLYFLMVDRFHNGNEQNDSAVADTSIHPKANYMGGDLAGVQQKIEQGFFDELGTNTIWLSPITQNPWGAYGLWNKGRVHSRFSGYHGYWPISNTQIDQRFGDPKSLRLLLNDAHTSGQNVILDYVANHVHQEHPIYQQHPDWATPLYLPDGTKNTEKWDEHRLTTWFDDHLPTLELRDYAVVDPLVDSALFWLTQYDFDGFRHDATKHIDELYWRTLTYRIRTQVPQSIYQIGETYGSPALIRSYVSTGMLDAQFDFNLYDAAVEAFAKEEGNVDNLTEKLNSSLKTYGYHHLMGNISGNQDRARFITLADGELRFEEDHKLAGWEREFGKPNEEAYQRLALLHAFNYAIPGLPCTYYGDEYGLPGAGDPDNRRMMEFGPYDQQERELRERFIKLNALRASQMPLLYGSTEIEELKEGLIRIRRRYLNQVVDVYLNSTESSQRIVPENDLRQATRHFQPALQAALEEVEEQGGLDEMPLPNADELQSELKLAPLSFEYITYTIQ